MNSTDLPPTRMPASEVWPPPLPSIGTALQDMVDHGETSYYGREGYVEKLEDGFRELLGIPYALATSSGTAALHSAYAAASLGPGDEVICPTLTYSASVTPIFHVNAIPVLVDCSSIDGNVTVETIRPKLTPRTRAISVTHMWGHPVDMDPILELAQERRLIVIEDCSHAHGTVYKGRPVGTIGDMGVFSLQGRKLIVAGQGGMLVTNNRNYYERAVLLGHFRVRAEQSVELPHNRPWVRTGYGLNYRMHPFGACLAWHHLQKIQDYIARRARNCGTLGDAFTRSAFFGPPPVSHHATVLSWYNYKIHVRPPYRDVLRDDLLDLLCHRAQAIGLPIGRPSNFPLHLERLFQVETTGLRPYEGDDRIAGNTYRSYRPGDLPISEEFHSTTCNVTVFTQTDFTPFAGELVTKLDALCAEILGGTQ